jgi:uncharacterized membrane protein YidH (DUF202 family)
MRRATRASRAIVDPGTQAERTRLSWNRTGLALAVNAALLVHTTDGSLMRHVPAAAMLVVALACFLLADRRYRRITASVRSGRSVASIAHVRTLAAVAVLPAVIALAGVLVP